MSPLLDDEDGVGHDGASLEAFLSNSYYNSNEYLGQYYATGRETIEEPRMFVFDLVGQDGPAPAVRDDVKQPQRETINMCALNFDDKFCHDFLIRIIVNINN